MCVWRGVWGRPRTDAAPSQTQREALRRFRTRFDGQMAEVTAGCSGALLMHAAALNKRTSDVVRCFRTDGEPTWSGSSVLWLRLGCEERITGLYRGSATEQLINQSEAAVIPDSVVKLLSDSEQQRRLKTLHAQTLRPNDEKQTPVTSCETPRPPSDRAPSAGSNGPPCFVARQQDPKKSSAASIVR